MNTSDTRANPSTAQPAAHDSAPLLAHPLELIPLFRRWPPTVLRNTVYTVIFSSVIALVLAAIQLMSGSGHRPSLRYLWAMLWISNLIGGFIYGGMLLANRLLGGWPRRARGMARLAFNVALVSVSVLLGLGLGNLALTGTSPLVVFARPAVVVQCLAIALLIGVFMYVVINNAEKRVKAAMEAARQQEFVASSARLLAEARLRALQAQIEPHFLYNTLANVVSLIGPQPARAQHMLERFIDYLRASLAAGRSDAVTLGGEADLLKAYLDVLAVRMGERLRYRIDIPAELRAFAMAPMLLQPLVENAIAHGLEPKVDGGEIAIGARADGAHLCIEIRDTGVGLLPAAPRKPGGGVGLSNLRERLASLHGGAARVELLENQPCGMTVRLMLPLNASLT